VNHEPEILIGKRDGWGASPPFGISAADHRHHIYIIGKTGAGKTTLLRYLDQMEKRPHDVRKQQNGQWITIKEYFLTDLAEMMNEDGLLVGMTPTPEEEVVGVDTLESLEAVQKLYARRRGSQ